ncbi:hypothetical protein EW145_g1141 [Phellinidium pouzarii]|uniref:SGNH hydrolase-type esterase domain-containing protein n=1 Tax=Phellinidium pouzarii TaxID=167371 RepID=A0A4S4LFL4_9AGAM|nr:hypothetical protein EW145_g1141 [Phellinidium pouzarii]
MSRFISTVGNYWPGYDVVKKLIIFGDSYSSVGYDPDWPAPTSDEPLGVPFPGFTWTEGGEDMGDSTNPNWVGHLVTTRRKNNKPLLVYDYAVGGHTLSGLRKQVELWFLPTVGKKPDWAPWGADDTLFVMWIGINDCAYGSEHASNIRRLFGLQEALYESGARNFLLIDVPPIHHSPAFSYALRSDPGVGNPYDKWNDELHKGAEAFHTKHPEITLLMYSSWEIFNKVNRDPEAFGFSEEDIKKRGGAIWHDHLHPTSKMHAVIADDLDAFLKKYEGNGTSNS